MENTKDLIEKAWQFDDQPLGIPQRSVDAAGLAAVGRFALVVASAYAEWQDFVVFGGTHHGIGLADDGRWVLAQLHSTEWPTENTIVVAETFANLWRALDDNLQAFVRARYAATRDERMVELDREQQSDDGVVRERAAAWMEVLAIL